MKRNLFLSVLTLCAFCQLFSASQAQQNVSSSTPAISPIRLTPESRAHAKKLYLFDCEMCHNLNGDGKGDLALEKRLVLPDWSDAKTLANKSDGELFDVIRTGKGEMEAVSKWRSNDDEVWGLVLYIKSLSRK